MGKTLFHFDRVFSRLEGESFHFEKTRRTRLRNQSKSDL